MEELQVGEFIRTKSGEIYKIDYVGESVVTAGEEVIIPLNYIENHSFKLIDLVKKGDYVNGNKVYEEEKIYEEEKELYIYDTDIPEEEWGTDAPIYMMVVYLQSQDDNFIKSIVTSEKFTSVEFKVEE